MKKLPADVMGTLLNAFFEKKAMFEIVERDDGYINAEDGAPKYYLAQYKQWPRWEKQAMKHVHGRVLDIGCGAGRQALYLQDKGHDVTGIDVSPLAISLCKKRGVKNAKVLAIEHIDKFKPSSFDTAIMMGNNFGLFGNFKKARKLLLLLHKITSPQAVIVAETLDPYGSKDPNHTGYHARNRKLGRMGGQVRIRLRYGKMIGDWFYYLFVSESELADILHGTGWRLKKTIQSDGPQYIAIIEKSGF
jgi:SAM-dependent methyltransferase